MIIGITGKAGSGKDTIADILVRNHGFVKVSLADPMKRACAEWFGWDAETLWGASEKRNAIDPRYRKAPREALQKLGTEWGRGFHEDVWINYALEVAAQIDKGHEYYPTRGTTVETGPPHDVVIPDIRFGNELKAIQAVHGKVIRVVRPPQGSSADTVADVLWKGHASETEQDGFPTDLITATYENTGTLEDIEREINDWMETQ